MMSRCQTPMSRHLTLPLVSPRSQLSPDTSAAPVLPLSNWCPRLSTLPFFLLVVFFVVFSVIFLTKWALRFSSSFCSSRNSDGECAPRFADSLPADPARVWRETDHGTSREAVDQRTLD
jgi:hypothetical protein